MGKGGAYISGGFGAERLFGVKFKRVALNIGMPKK